MRDDYKLVGPKAPLNCEVEKEVVGILQEMSIHTKHSVNELVNTAVKNFISRHKDFLPPNANGTQRS